MIEFPEAIVLARQVGQTLSGRTIRSVAANTTINSRTGSLTVAGQTFSVTQAGVSCSYSISPASSSVGSSAASGTVSVTAVSGCSWTAASNASWITVTSGSSGSGNGTVGYTVTANGSSSSRTASLTIAGKTLTVTQAAGGGVPVISVFPSSVKFGNVILQQSSTKTVTVTNNGTAPLTIGSVAITGTQANQFNESHGCSQLDPGNSCSIQVTFYPTTAGSKSATLQINSNDPARSRVSIPLSGRTVRYSLMNKGGD